MKQDSQLWQAFAKRSKQANGKLHERHHNLSKEVNGSLQHGCSLSLIKTAYGGLGRYYLHLCLQGPDQGIGLLHSGVVDAGVAECQGSRRGYGVLTVYHCPLVVRSSRLTTHCCSVSLPLTV